MATTTVFGRYYEDPSSAPVVAQKQQEHSNEDEHNRTCRACHSKELRVDWAQGDRVCTACGVVDEGHLMDDRAEWREFNDVDDRAKGRPALARSGLVLVDESLYLGGLQSTKIGQIFGTHTSRSSATRKRLVSVNRRLDRSMEKVHKRALENARTSHILRKRRRHEEGLDDTGDVRPEYEQMLLQEEEDANRIQMALYADKWSLTRAIQFFGSDHEVSAMESDDRVSEPAEAFDRTLTQASKDLYNAYAMLKASASRLNIPPAVETEATQLLCRYAALRDGIVVRGVSTALKTARHPSSQQAKDAREALRDYNRSKQAGALCASLLLYACRNAGQPRSLDEVCKSIQPAEALANRFQVEPGSFIKKKDISRGIAEVKAAFPDHVRFPAMQIFPSSNETLESPDLYRLSKFAEHTISTLRLPPVAEAAVRVLVVHVLRRIESRNQATQPPKLPMICAAVAHFVCQTGSLMQKFSAQISRSQQVGHTPTLKNDQQQEPKLRAELDPDNDFDALDTCMPYEIEASEHRVYELCRMWDAWSDQTPWHRSVVEIERACGAASHSFLDLYRKELYPERRKWLRLLKNSVQSDGTREVLATESSLRETPLATALLAEIEVAASLLKKDS